MPRPHLVFLTYQFTRPHSVRKRPPSLVPQAQLSLSSLQSARANGASAPNKLKSDKCVRGKDQHNRLHIQIWMSGNSSTWDSYRWCRPVAVESQNEFGRKETEIFTNESDIFTF